ncbi:MAG: glyceraldehyde-3-phosphate dehydrogenase, partial [Microbacteriaceae bacterium]
MAQDRDAALKSWLDKEALAECMIPNIGKLYRKHRVVTTIHGRSLINQSAVSILKLHRFARQIDDYELDIAQTAPLVEMLGTLNLGTASIDIALLLQKFKQSGLSNLEAFLREELSPIIDAESDSNSSSTPKGTDVVLYG